jgi:drug/metabolite transporter (DMT)-like permease
LAAPVEEGRIEREAPAWQVWAALWTVYIVWGSTYLAIRIAVETLPPMLQGGVRFLVAGLVMYTFLLLRRGRAEVSVSARELGAAALVGAALLVGGNGVVAIAEQEVPSARAALIIASVPLWVVVLRFLTGEAVSRVTLGGVVVGFGGVALLVASGTAGEVAGWAQLLMIVASVSWATGSFFSQHLPLPANPFVSTALQMLCAGALLLVASVVSGEAFSAQPASFSVRSLGALGYLVVAGSLGAFSAYTWLLQHAPISKVATYAYVNPVVAVFLGWLILAERITPVIVIAAAIIVASVASIVRQEHAGRRGRRGAAGSRIEPEPPPEASAPEATPARGARRRGARAAG